MKDLNEFLQEYYPESLEAYKRLINPNYWECGIIYNPQVSGFGCSGKSDKKLVLKDATVFKDDKHFHLYELNNLKQSYTCTEKEAPFKLKRVDEDVEYKDNMINNGMISYVNTEAGELKVNQMYFRDYRTKKLRFRILVYPLFNLNVCWDYYSAAGTGYEMLKFNKSGHDNYDFYSKISVRKFKSMVFGDPNIKIPSTKGKI